MTPIQLAVPIVENQFVYVLISRRQFPNVVKFIGETGNDLLQEWKLHNSGEKSQLTNALHFRPWCIAAFVYNIVCEEDRLCFHRRIQSDTL